MVVAEKAESEKEGGDAEEKEKAKAKKQYAFLMGLPKNCKEFEEIMTRYKETNGAPVRGRKSQRVDWAQFREVKSVSQKMTIQHPWVYYDHHVGLVHHMRSKRMMTLAQAEAAWVSLVQSDADRNYEGDGTCKTVLNCDGRLCSNGRAQCNS